LGLLLFRVCQRRYREPVLLIASCNRREKPCQDSWPEAILRWTALPSRHASFSHSIARGGRSFECGGCLKADVWSVGAFGKSPKYCRRRVGANRLQIAYRSSASHFWWIGLRPGKPTKPQSGLRRSARCKGFMEQLARGVSHSPQLTLGRVSHGRFVIVEL